MPIVLLIDNLSEMFLLTRFLRTVRDMTNSTKVGNLEHLINVLNEFERVCFATTN